MEWHDDAHGEGEEAALAGGSDTAFTLIHEGPSLPAAHQQKQKGGKKPQQAAQIAEELQLSAYDPLFKDDSKAAKAARLARADAFAACWAALAGNIQASWGRAGGFFDRGWRLQGVELMWLRRMVLSSGGAARLVLEHRHTRTVLLRQAAMQEPCSSGNALPAWPPVCRRPWRALMPGCLRICWPLPSRATARPPQQAQQQGQLAQLQSLQSVAGASGCPLGWCWPAA